ncbi:hypothetical protein [Photobacterium sp. J15]|uniref:hypothetical protein n=1 Tax=Photobacterium sp. J15 TaxID=265901 RepID=UPI0007E364CC|nr:hypothetical protein [Photobacterium sp. J15]
MNNKVILLASILAATLTGCSEDTSSSTSNSTSAQAIDASKPNEVLKLGNNYKIDFGIKSIKPLSDSHFNVDATVFSNELMKNGFFAQVNGITKRNYKTFSDAEFSFDVTATTAEGKKYQLTNYNVYYENFTSTKVPAELAIAKIENDPNNVKLWGKITSAKIDRDFVDNNEGSKFSIDNMRPMNLYVRVADTLSNGIQFLPTAPDNSTNQYQKVSNGNCTIITDTTGELNRNGIKHKTCIEVHGYKIPLLIEDKAQQNSEAKVAHVKKIMVYYLNHLPAEITKAISDSNATMAFFYDEDWSDRAGDFMEENYRFQDLFSTETTTTDTDHDKDYLANKRDAAFEEILHFVHDYGIMNYAIAHPTSQWAAMQKELDTLNEKAIRSGNYYPNGKVSTIAEADLDAESYDQEYLAYALYAYYDINNKNFAASESKSSTYADLTTNDPDMVKFLDKYFPARNDFKATFPGYPNN